MNNDTTTIKRKVGNKREAPKSVRMPSDTQQALQLLSKLEGKSMGQLLTEMSADLIERKYPELKQILDRSSNKEVLRF